MIRTLVLALVLTISLTACKSAQITPTGSQDIAYVCAGIAAAEDTFAALNRAGKISKAQWGVMQHVIAVKSPVCNVSPMPTSVTALGYAELSAALHDLTAITGTPVN